MLFVIQSTKLNFIIKPKFICTVKIPEEAISIFSGEKGTYSAQH